MGSRHRRADALHGFTLIELLVVIAILSVLIAILLPSLTRAKELTRRALCMNLQRGIVLATALYCPDYANVYPTCHTSGNIIQVGEDNNTVGVRYGVGLLVQGEYLPVVDWKSAADVLFCPSYLKEYEGYESSAAGKSPARRYAGCGNTRPHNVGAALAYMETGTGFPYEGRIPYTMRSCGAGVTEPLRVATAMKYSPILLADVQFGPLREQRTHGDEGLNATSPDGAVQWIPMDSIDWADSVPFWQIGHQNIEPSSNLPVTYNFWYWTRENL